MSFITLMKAFQPLLREAKRRGGSGAVYIYDQVKCAPCGKQVTLRGIRTRIRKRKQVIELYEGKCEHCGATTKVEHEKKW